METWIRIQWSTATVDLFLDACGKVDGQMRHLVSRVLAMREGIKLLGETVYGEPGAGGKDLQSVTDNITKVFEDRVEDHSSGTKYEAGYQSSELGKSTECYSKSDVIEVRPHAAVRNGKSPLIKAVLRHGSDKWYQLASAMGFSPSQITSFTSDKPNLSDKLLATIHEKLRRIGQEETEKILVEAIKEIQPPIYEEVCGDIGKEP
jgi:hypothetical protein